MWGSARVNGRSTFFNINICNMVFEKYECDIANYTDDNTPHIYDSDLYTILKFASHNILHYLWSADLLKSF